MARKARPWTCRCGWKNEPRKKKCARPSCGKLRPKKRVGKRSVEYHDRSSYEHYLEVAEVLHGVTDERCCCCGRPKNPRFKHDREHDHRTGFPRGLACSLCNMLMRDSRLDARYAQLIASYLKRAETYPQHFTKPEGHEAQNQT